MKKLLYIAPHLSTGGLPQYLLKKIQLLSNDYDIYLIEWVNHTGGRFIVQREQLVELLGNKFFELKEDKSIMLDIIKDINPDIIHIEEIPEFFMDYGLAEAIYTSTRKYLIVETSHDSSYDVTQKSFYPDYFAFVSEWQVEQYKNFGVPKSVVYYPIEYKERSVSRKEALLKLGLDPNKKHVAHVGLFTPRKNQAEFFEYARAIPDVEFHCIGNQADNFKHYWEPLMEKKPANLTIWGERNDVDNFYQAVDLFLFTSRGTVTDKETMPLVIREALSWKLPILIYNLPVYLNYFNQFDNIKYLDFNDFSNNVNSICQTLDVTPPIIDTKQEAVIISTYPVTDSIISTTRECILKAKKTNRDVILVSHAPIPEELQDLSDYCIYDKNNILTKHTYYCNYFYYSDQYDCFINLRGENNDVYHGPTVYTNNYNGAALAHKLGYKKVFFLNYDYYIENSTFLTKVSKVLDSYNYYCEKIEKSEGLNATTFFYGTRPEWYLNNFKLIKNANEYEALYKEWGSESNGLENMMYHKLKTLDKVYFEDTQVFRKHVEESFTHQDFSRVEYYTVLPVENQKSIAPYIQISNSKDSKLIKLTVKHDDIILEKEYQVVNKFNSYEVIEYTDKTYTVTFDIYDLSTNKHLETREIIVDSDYYNNILPHNGKLTLK